MNRARVAGAAGVVVIAVTAAVLLLGGGGADDALAASGSVEAAEADLGFQTGGRIAAVAVAEGDAVAPGQELARLDHAELDARRAAAEAQLGAARALLRELEQGARPDERRQAGAAAAAARERMDEAARLLERSRTLEAAGAVSRESLEQARTAHEVARAQYDQARAQAALVTDGPRPERVAAQRAVVQQAEAAVAQVAAAASNAVITAPFSGVVTIRHRRAGETVGPGAPVVTVMDASDRWVRIYVREDEVGNVVIGQAAEIRSDSDPSRVVSGRVTHIASEAEFTPRNVQTAAERVKLVYAVKVAVLGDSGLLLKPGVPADVRLLR